VSVFLEKDEIRMYDLSQLASEDKGNSAVSPRSRRVTLQTIPRSILQCSNLHFSSVRMVSWLPHGRFATLSNDCVRVFDFEPNSSRRCAHVHLERTLSNYFGNGELRGAWIQGELLLVASDRFICWDLSTGSKVFELNIGGAANMGCISDSTVLFDR
jgi:hypothetical protein